MENQDYYVQILIKYFVVERFWHLTIFSVLPKSNVVLQSANGNYLKIVVRSS